MILAAALPMATAHAASQSDLSASITELNNQVTKAAEQMTQIDNQINQINQKISNNEQTLSQTEADLKTAKKNMGERARVMYMFNTDGFLSAVFSSKNLTEALTKAAQIKAVNSADQKTVANVEKLESQVKATQADLNAQKQQLSEEKQKVQEQQNTYNQKLAEEQKQLEAYAAQNTSSAASTTSGSTADPGDQLDFICAVVAAECNSSYDGALAVISCVMNRVDSGKWGGKDAVSVLKAPGQFAAYLDGPYKKYLGGKYPDYVKQAVIDCMQGGKRSHPYQSFRAGSSYGVWNCGGNSYR
jgi:peptidoglycan hydrolase CwlO-like protein